MMRLLKNISSSFKLISMIDWRNIFSLPNLAAVIISFAVVSVAINSSGVMIKNYKLEKQISELEQRVRVAQDEADKQRLKNQYFATDAFLDIATRRQLTKGAPGEKLIIVPKNVALTFASEKPVAVALVDTDENNVKSPAQKWFDFLLGRGLPD